jgi:hypothetical protein
MKSMQLVWITWIVSAIACVAAVRAQEPAPMLVEAKYDDEQMIWTLGDQVWEFGELDTAYLPAKGSYNPETREAVWILQIVRDLTPGEVGFQSTLAGSPFRPSFLDADKILLAGDAPVKFTPITGRQGDSVRVTIRLPDEAGLAKVALIRVEKRTEIGF